MKLVPNLGPKFLDSKECFSLLVCFRLMKLARRLRAEFLELLFNEQVKRNKSKFPNDFVFQPTNKELETITKRCSGLVLRSIFVTANELSSKKI